MNKLALLVLCVAAIAYSCNTSKKTATSDKPGKELTPGEPAKFIPEPEVYRASRTHHFDLLHTSLRVSFNYQKEQLYGNATLTLKPYFYPTNILELDARGFELKEVQLVQKKSGVEIGRFPLKYKYDNEILKIDFEKTLTRNDTVYIVIDYIAKPNELNAGGSAAITSDKGLYFINPLRLNKNKPRQIWTQGETQANSAWFPTIDSPGEKMTHDILITCDKTDVTLSNGVLEFSKDNGDGTRSDYWKMDKPHSTYLTMMAVGEFSVIQDKWRGIDVNYLVEKDYEPYAKAIFGNTPQMIEFYSTILGVDYPWQKYSQVVVRDYVSGAMENTTATLHGEFVQRTDRELIDGNTEDIIAHELFHQWFGDLVTAESWSNLPLNESFATYGEYLWIEHKDGRDDADRHLQSDLNSYLMEAQQKQANMVRFDWVNREDMFDSHSYAKGGRILHMLRKYVGDEAFFESLKLYLTKNKFKCAEVHDLRLAFEEVTGEDLNWFFNQWFYAKGHPVLKVTHKYNDSLKVYSVNIEQRQNFETTPLYKLPFEIDIYESGVKRKEKVVLTQANQTFTFKVETKPSLVNVDAEKVLLCSKQEEKSAKEWEYQYFNCPLYLDRYEAINNLSKMADSPEANNVAYSALKDKSEYIRNQAINLIPRLAGQNKTNAKEKLIEIVNTDKKSSVRENALYSLSDNYSGPDLLPLFEKAATDRSYIIICAGLNTLKKADKEKALSYAKRYETEKNGDIISTIAALYSELGTVEENEFFAKASANLSGFTRYSFTQFYTQYLMRMPDEIVDKGLPIIESTARNENAWWMRLSGVQALLSLSSNYENMEKETKDLLAKAKQANQADKAIELEQRINQLKAQREKITVLVEDIKKNEKDPNIVRILGN